MQMKYEYKVVRRVRRDEVENEVNALGQLGYRVVTMEVTPRFQGGESYIVLMEKATQPTGFRDPNPGVPGVNLLP